MKKLIITSICLMAVNAYATCSNYTSFTDGQVLTAGQLNSLQTSYTNCINTSDATVDINGGTIDGVTIGASSAPTVTNLGTVTTADINGGTIDGVTIGATVAPTVTNLGIVTTADINGGTIDGVTIGATVAPTVTNLGTVTTVDINGGTVDGVTIGGASAAGGTFTTLNATGGGAMTGTWTNLGTVTTVDLNGGTIDATTIGATTPAAGTFSDGAMYGQPIMYSKTYILPEYIQAETDTVAVFPVESGSAPNGILITKFGIKTDASSTYSVVLENWSSAGAWASDISTVATGATLEAESGVLSSTVAAGSIVFIDLPTTTGLKWLQVWFIYEMKP